MGPCAPGVPGAFALDGPLPITFCDFATERLMRRLRAPELRSPQPRLPFLMSTPVTEPFWICLPVIMPAAVALMAETARANDDLSIENDPGNEVLDFLLLLHQRLADVLPEDLEDSDHELMVLRAASRLYERKDGMPEWEQDVADTIRGRLTEFEGNRAT